MSKERSRPGIAARALSEPTFPFLAPSRTAMLIAIIGPPCAGKHLLQQHLVTTHQYTKVTISAQTPPPARDDPTSLHFTTASAFLDYATTKWRRDYVTLDLRKSGAQLREFLKRPFVAVVSVNAPVGLRYSRQVKR